MGRILGIDWGEARCGISLSDLTETIASPLPAWDRRANRELGDYLQELVKEHQIEKIVLGFPRDMSGTIGKKARETMSLQENLTKTLNLPVVLWDERLTSVSAKRFLKENKIRSKKDKKVIDTISAVLILQSFLDSQRI